MRKAVPEPSQSFPHWQVSEALLLHPLEGVEAGGAEAAQVSLAVGQLEGLELHLLALFSPENVKRISMS